MAASEKIIVTLVPGRDGKRDVLAVREEDVRRRCTCAVLLAWEEGRRRVRKEMEEEKGLEEEEVEHE